jgi:hypothetical protein
MQTAREKIGQLAREALASENVTPENLHTRTEEWIAKVYSRDRWVLRVFGRTHLSRLVADNEALAKVCGIALEIELFNELIMAS